MKLYDQEFEYTKSGFYDEDMVQCLYCSEITGEYEVDDYGYRTSSLKAQVSDWSGATPGATYKATITYVITTW